MSTIHVDDGVLTLSDGRTVTVDSPDLGRACLDALATPDLDGPLGEVETRLHLTDGPLGVTVSIAILGQIETVATGVPREPAALADAAIHAIALWLDRGIHLHPFNSFAIMASDTGDVVHREVFVDPQSSMMRGSLPLFVAYMTLVADAVANRSPRLPLGATTRRYLAIHLPKTGLTDGHADFLRALIDTHPTVEMQFFVVPN